MPIHIEADEEDVADTVLLPGNPQRAEYIAENFLDDPVLYNDYREMYGYTGEYNGKKVSVQTTGMGVPSLSIILEELNMLGTKKWIRVGTSGALQEFLDLGDLIIAQSSASVGTTVDQLSPSVRMSPSGDFELIKSLHDRALTMDMPVHVGQIVTSDYFYGVGEGHTEELKKLSDFGALAVEMETSALYTIASKYGIKAATTLTVSDHVFEEERAEKEKIQEGVDKMTSMVLETVT